jgi:hypothetical protein
MFGDNLTVDMWKIPYVNLGTLSLQDVRNNYDATLKERMWTGTTLVFREYRRGEKIVAYVASEFQMDVDLWEMAASGDKVDAKLVYIDRRSFSDTGGGGSDSSTH